MITKMQFIYLATSRIDLIIQADTGHNRRVKKMCQKVNNFENTAKMMLMSIKTIYAPFYSLIINA